MRSGATSIWMGEMGHYLLPLAAASLSVYAEVILLLQLGTGESVRDPIADGYH